MKSLRRLYGFVKALPLAVLGILTVAASVGGWVYLLFIGGLLENKLDLGDVTEMAIIAPLIAIFLLCPVFLSLYNLFYLVLPDNSPRVRRAGIVVEVVTILFGAACTCLWISFRLNDVYWDKDWWEQLYNSELHTPIATWTMPTVHALIALGFAGYLVCRCVPAEKTPPLVTVLGIGAMYVGSGFWIVWMLQLGSHEPLLLVYPANLLLIFAKVLRERIVRWRQLPHEQTQAKSPLLGWLCRLVNRCENWPWLAFLAAVPLLGLVIGVLTLFGQAPDAMIQAWTQTSDWTFSQQIAPENLPLDGHYLCTVAARGHRRVVKPLRIGLRHGHRVTVNRQLLVANAFEELLQERLPRFHRAVRRFYDRYGYPIARHIHSPLASDFVWLVMKPGEWFFLAVLYLFDPHPENRIAVQYPHSPPPGRK